MKSKAPLIATIALILGLSFLIYQSGVLSPKLLAGKQNHKDIDPSTLTGRYNPTDSQATYNGKSISPPLASTDTPSSAVLGQTNANRRIEIDLAQQRLYAYEGDTLVYNFLISSGLWGKTPTGTFRIWTKLRYTKMEGGSKALNTYYYLPNVPFVMYFYNAVTPKIRGFGLHGTYWHSNFGHPMSHGCINMKTEEAEKIFYWASPDLQGRQSIFANNDNLGTEITIYGKAP